VEFVSAFGLGALITIVVQHWLDRRSEQDREQRAARRDIYTEVLTLMQVRKAATYKLSYRLSDDPPPDIDEERIGRLNALVSIDGTAAMREPLNQCYRRMQMFWNSYEMDAPIAVDAQGMFSYDSRDKVSNPEAHRMKVDLCLSRLDQQFGDDVEALAKQIKQELHRKQRL
jgi:hypothetical protein